MRKKTFSAKPPRIARMFCFHFCEAANDEEKYRV